MHLFAFVLMLIGLLVIGFGVVVIGDICTRMNEKLRDEHDPAYGEDDERDGGLGG